MLNMRSAQPDGEAEDDRTARARIRDAAIECIATHGVAGTSIRAVATAAGVSPALVIHHFGSKEGLRLSCDEYVARLIHERKMAANQAGPALDPLAALRQTGSGPPVLRYLARTLTDRSPQTAALVDALVANATAQMIRGVETGTVRPYHDEYARAAVLAIWTLGALVLHEHIERLLGEDLTGDPMKTPRYLNAVVDILGESMLTEPLHARLRDALASLLTTDQSGKG
jgi:AcrR family transcriptional regulator